MFVEILRRTATLNTWAHAKPARCIAFPSQAFFPASLCLSSRAAFVEVPVVRDWGYLRIKMTAASWPPLGLLVVSDFSHLSHLWFLVVGLSQAESLEHQKESRERHEGGDERPEKSKHACVASAHTAPPKFSPSFVVGLTTKPRVPRGCSKQYKDESAPSDLFRRRKRRSSKQSKHFLSSCVVGVVFVLLFRQSHKRTFLSTGVSRLLRR